MKLSGHIEPVLTLDFHPREADLLCSSDSTGEIRLWNINEAACIRVSKGASRQVRFQPEVGKHLAAATGNTLNLIDFETNIVCYRLEGHVKDIRSICWDTTGNYIASVSSDGARVWSIVSGGKCISELPSSGNKFESFIFHPSNSQLLVIGSQKLLKIWNPTESNETLSINAHDAVISGLAASPRSKLMASVSHDQRMKLWR